jgi:hypothetical protein
MACTVPRNHQCVYARRNQRPPHAGTNEAADMTRGFSSIILCAVGALAFFLIRGQIDTDIVNLDPGVAYKAEVSLQINNEMIDGTTWHIPGFTRSEYNFEGVSIVELHRWKEDRTYFILPELHQFVRVNHQGRKRATAQLNSLVVRFASNIREVGTEQYEGHKVTQYRFDDHNVKVLFWVTEEGLLVRMKFQGEDRGQSVDVEYSLSNIEVGSQDPAKFQLPKGYRQVPSVRHLRR